MKPTGTPLKPFTLGSVSKRLLDLAFVLWVSRTRPPLDLELVLEYEPACISLFPVFYRKDEAI
jgi:hypothetical protein